LLLLLLQKDEGMMIALVVLFAAALVPTESCAPVLQPQRRTVVAAPVGRRLATAVPRRQALSMMATAAKTKPKKVIVLGGDGFCGWPTSLYLSDQGHEVIIVDNLSRRKIDLELGCDSLTPIASIEQRCDVWNSVSGKKNLRFKYLDLQHDYQELLQLLKEEKPDTVVHFAEQRAAPYSMKDARLKRYTIDNNVSGTHNLLCAIVESGLDIHVVHLGTMGVYGYGSSGGEIPEGYLDVTLPGGRPGALLFALLVAPCPCCRS
jgi:UDP-sulfoquinovose synthase